MKRTSRAVSGGLSRLLRAACAWHPRPPGNVKCHVLGGGKFALPGPEKKADLALRAQGSCVQVTLQAGRL